MAWTNIFDLGEWDIYIRFLGTTIFPTPNSRDSLVRADELDPEVGVVTVQDGVVVCEMESQSGAGGIGIQVILMPVGAAPAIAPLRVSATSGQVELLPMEGGDESTPLYATVSEVSEMGGGEYEATHYSTATVATGATMTNFAFGASAYQPGRGVGVTQELGGL